MWSWWRASNAMMRRRFPEARRPVSGADDDQGCPRRDESVDKLLRPCQVDVALVPWRGFATIPARVVDVDVAAILM